MSTILVVDDYAVARRILSHTLQKHGHVVVGASDGHEALARLDDTAVDLAIIDIAMPGMDGHELAKRIRQLVAPNPVLVALSGYGQEEDRRRGIDAGFDHYLVKPTSIDALRQLLTTVPAMESAVRQ